MNANDFIVFMATIVASTSTFFFVLALISLHVWKKEGLVAGALVLGSSVFLGLTVLGLKLFFAVPRPVEALVQVTGYAFPSGHASGVMFMAIVLDWYLRTVVGTKRVLFFRLLLLLLVIAIGYSRLYLQVHTIGQVAAGFVVGAVVGGAFLKTMSRRTKLS